MNESLFQPPWGFLSLPKARTAPDKARAWVLPVPYDATVCYGSGTRNGPAAILTASRAIEVYDYEFGCETGNEFGVHTLPPLAPQRKSPEAMIAAVEEAVADAMKSCELLAVFGGEHTISAGVARGAVRAVGAKDLVCVQIDAHADLWDSYEGSQLSHACAARRIVETCPIFQIGVRNIAAAEDKFRRSSDRVTTVFAEETGWLPKLAEFVRGKTVFLTVDLDGLDPSIMPAVGTPEPGGLTWQQVLDVARTVCREAKRMPVFDVVELSPIPGMMGPDFLAAKLVYKVMSLELLKPGRK
jgi:agmatinase